MSYNMDKYDRLNIPSIYRGIKLTLWVTLVLCILYHQISVDSNDWGSMESAQPGAARIEFWSLWKR